MGHWTNTTAETKAKLKINIAELIGELEKVSGIDIEWDDAEIEFDGEDVVIETPIRLDVKIYYDPGCMWDRFGDPGDPPEWDMKERFSEVDIGKAIDSAKISAWLEIENDLDEWEF